MSCRFTMSLVVLFSAAVSDGTCDIRADEQSYRMPEYPDEPPPPGRTQSEIDNLLSGGQTPEDVKPLRVVLVAGEKDHKRGEHDYPNWQKVWSRLLKLEKQTTVDTALGFPDQRQIDAADVLVFYQRGNWDEARAASIDPFSPEEEAPSTFIGRSTDKVVRKSSPGE